LTVMGSLIAEDGAAATAVSLFGLDQACRYGDKLLRDVMLLVSRLSNMRFPFCDPGYYRYRRLFTGTIQLNFAR
jgi:hypothetical protein